MHAHVITAGSVCVRVCVLVYKIMGAHMNACTLASSRQEACSSAAARVRTSYSNCYSSACFYTNNTNTQNTMASHHSQIMMQLGSAILTYSPQPVKASLLQPGQVQREGCCDRV